MHNLTTLDTMYTLLDAESNIDSLLLTINVDSLSRFTWTNAEQDSIQDIAERCAYTYGKSVFNARAMWSSFDTLATPLITCEIPNPVSSRNSGVQTTDKKDETNVISIYPNPANNSLTISIPNNEEEVIIEFIDVSGRTVKSISTNLSNMQVLDVSSLSAGWYAVSITRPISGRFVQPVFIEN